MSEKADKTPEVFRLSPVKSKYLLIVNRGRDSVELKREGDKWDLLEIYFVPSMIEDIRKNPSQYDVDHIVFESDRQWKKYRILKKIFETNDFWRSYDAIMIADDDLEPVGCSISQIFDLFMQTGCRVGQPALTQDSYFAHPVTVKNNNFIWRKTNFVEIMCPIFTREGLERYLPVFDATLTNFGLDFYWGHHETLSGFGLAVLDQTPMRHTRPVGGGVAYEGLVNPQEEYIQFMIKHGISEFVQSCLGGVADKRFGEEWQNMDRFLLGLIVAGYSDQVTKHAGFNKYLASEIRALLSKKS